MSRDIQCVASSSRFVCAEQRARRCFGIVFHRRCYHVSTTRFAATGTYTQPRLFSHRVSSFLEKEEMIFDRCNAAKREKFNYLRYEYQGRSFLSSSNLNNLVINLCVSDDDIVT